MGWGRALRVEVRRRVHSELHYERRQDPHGDMRHQQPEPTVEDDAGHAPGVDPAAAARRQAPGTNKYIRD